MKTIEIILITFFVAWMLSSLFALVCIALGGFYPYILPTESKYYIMAAWIHVAWHGAGICGLIYCVVTGIKHLIKMEE
jgi:hypothetical protein